MKLTDEQLAWLRHMLGGTSPMDMLVVRLLDEHRDMKALWTEWCKTDITRDDDVWADFTNRVYAAIGFLE